MENVTSLEALAEYAKGQLVRLPDFSEGQPFVARLRRPSIMALAKNGKIPNSLLNTATGLFNGKGANDKDKRSLQEVFSVLELMCEAAFVEPKYSDLKELGIELTDEQYMAVFNYAQSGVKALEPFRIQPSSNVVALNSETV